MTKRKRINPDDIIGNKYGRLTVVSYIGKTERYVKIFECECECGNNTTVYFTNLIQGFSKSCGCLRKEVAKESHESHGESNTRLYTTWNNIKIRCYYECHRQFDIYGGRGIVMCDEWRNSYEAFRDWAMQNGYNDRLTIDRIDSNGNYEPSNCRWSTMKEQARNKRNTKYVTYNGIKDTLAEWVDRLGLDYNAVAQRIDALGWSVEKAFNTPVNRYKKRA